MYVLGFFVTYIGLVIFNRDSLDGRDVADNMDLYVIMLVSSSVFPITWFVVPVVLGTQWFLGLFKKVAKNENI